MATKQEKEDLAKLLKGVDNKWKALSIMWTYRNKEAKNIFIFILMTYSAIITFKAFPGIFQAIWNLIKGVLK